MAVPAVPVGATHELTAAKTLAWQGPSTPSIPTEQMRPASAMAP